jgi:hypothetical protein
VIPVVEIVLLVTIIVVTVLQYLNQRSLTRQLVERHEAFDVHTKQRAKDMLRATQSVEKDRVETRRLREETALAHRRIDAALGELRKRGR